MNRLEKFLPPGLNPGLWRNYMNTTEVLSVIFAITVFGGGLYSSLLELYDPFSKELLKDARMWDYERVLGVALDGFSVFSIACIVSFLIQHYTYFYRESKSIYIMARVRSPWELHIRCWTLPLLGVGILMGSRLLLRVILFVIYVLATPAGVPKPGFEQLIGGLL